MSELHEPLPEYFVTDERQRLVKPTYEALAQCQIIMASETGIVGPTLIEPGEVFSTDAIPNHQWLPLNRAAGERFEAWLASLPASGNGLSQAEITEAAYAMRPREGEPEIPHDSWWPAVLKYAAAMKDRRSGAPRIPQPAQAHRAGGKTQVMPFVSHGASMPGEGVGQPGPQDAPQRQAGADSGRRARAAAPRGASPLANSAASDSVAQTAGT